MPALVPVDVARLDEVDIDAVAVAFTVGLSVLRGPAVGCGSGPAVVAPRFGAHAERRKRAVRGRLPAAALQPVAGGAGDGAGGARPGAAGRHRPAAAQLRQTRHLRPRLRPGQRRFHRGVVSVLEPAIRGAGSTGGLGGPIRATPRAAARRDDGAAGVPAGRRSVRVVEEPALRERLGPYERNASPRGRHPDAEQLERDAAAEGPDRESRLPGGHAAPPPRRPSSPSPGAACDSRRHAR